MRNLVAGSVVMVGFAVTIVPLLYARPALSATVTRAEYVQRVEPICEAATRANSGSLRGVEGMVRKGELRRAAPQVMGAATALGSTVERLAAVPQPAADAARLNRWLGYGRAGEELLRRIGHSLERDNRGQVQGMADLALKEAKRANASVVGFGFVYCRLKVTRFV